MLYKQASSAEVTAVVEIKRRSRIVPRFVRKQKQNRMSHINRKHRLADQFMLPVLLFSPWPKFY